MREVVLRAVEQVAAAVEKGKSPIEPDPSAQRIARLTKVLGNGTKAAAKPARRSIP
jgi:hypothetical protein